MNQAQIPPIHMIEPKPGLDNKATIYAQKIGLEARPEQEHLQDGSKQN